MTEREIKKLSPEEIARRKAELLAEKTRLEADIARGVPLERGEESPQPPTTSVADPRISQTRTGEYDWKTPLGTAELVRNSKNKKEKARKDAGKGKGDKTKEHGRIVADIERRLGVPVEDLDEAKLPEELDWLSRQLSYPGMANLAELKGRIEDRMEEVVKQMRRAKEGHARAIINEGKGEIPEPAPGGRKITEEQERALLDRDFDPTTLAGLSADEADRQIADFDRKSGAAPAGGSRETEPAAKIEDKTTPAEKTEAKRAAAIAGLREVIANAQRKLEENRIERARLRERLQEIEEGGRREEADSPERERRETIEQDKKRNPFKYFLIDKMSDEVFKIIFGKGKGEVSLEEINRILGESGREVTYWNFNIISPETYNAVHHSSNGFSLQIQNPGEVTEEKEGKRVTMIDDPKAKYKLVSPDGTSEGNAPTYQEGYTLMEQKAGDYQARQIDEFDSEAELKELETIPTKEEKIRFLERKRKERIMNLKEVKRWIQIATEGTKSEHEGRRERSARELETLNSSPVKFFLDEVEFFKKNTSDNARESEAWYQTVVDEINVINARYDALIANLG